MLVTPPFGASSNIALWRAYSQPPVELVVADLEKNHMLRGIFEEMEKQNLPEKMIAAVKDTLECNPQFRGHLVSVEQMIMVKVGSIVLLGVLYLWMTSLREK